MRIGFLKLKCSTQVNWLWNNFSARALLVNIPRTWDVHKRGDRKDIWVPAFLVWCHQSTIKKLEIWQPPIRNHNIACRNLTKKLKLIPIFAKRQASVWRRRCYSGIVYQHLGKKDFFYLFIKMCGKLAKYSHTVFTNFSGDPYPVMTTLQNFSMEKNKAVSLKA